MCFAGICVLCVLIVLDGYMNGVCALYVWCFCLCGIVVYV